MRGGPSGHLGTSPPKCEFSKLCQLISTPEDCLSNDMEGVRFLHDVKPNMREKFCTSLYLWVTCCTTLLQ